MTDGRRATGRPEASEYADYATDDIAAVPGDDAVEALRELARETPGVFESLADAADQGLTYAPGKWTLKEILGHLIDDERVFAYRCLCVARGDGGEIPGFDEIVYVAHAGFDERSLSSLLEEYAVVRSATLAMFVNLPAEAWQRRGVVNGYGATVRGLAFHMAGHELHHLRVIQERYLPLVQRGPQ